VSGERPRPSKRAAALQIAGGALIMAGWYVAFVIGGLGERIDARSPALGIAAQIGGNALCALLVVAVGLRVSRQRWRDIGLGRAPLGPTIGWGLLGLLAVYVSQAVIVGALLGSGVLAWLPALDVTGHLDDKKRLAEQFNVLPLASVVPLALLVGFYEEVLFRGFLLSRVGVLLGVDAIEGAAPHQRRRMVLAVVVTALLFGAGHLYQGALGALQTTIAGIGLGALVALRRSLWPSIVAHAGIDIIGLLAARLLLPLADKLPV
jgi:membrane protease YdiL (CAAX protease family)